MTGAIRAIALNTFREAVRDRVLYLLAVFTALLILASRLVSQLTVGSEAKIIKDIGLSAMSLFGVLSAVFVGVSLVVKEVERRTIYTVLAHPVARWQFIAGKFCGLSAVLAVNLVLMTAVLFLILIFQGEAPWPLLPAIALILVELVVITACSLLFSSLVNPMLAALSTATIYVVGHLSWSLPLLKQRIEGTPGAVLCDVVYWVIPNLDRLNLKSAVVHGLSTPASSVLLATVYGLGYAVVVLALAVAAFERKEFQ